MKTENIVSKLKLQRLYKYNHSLKAPLVLCCASGNRSGQAFEYLTQHGIECLNGGSWMDVNNFQLQKI